MLGYGHSRLEEMLEAARDQTFASVLTLLVDMAQEYAMEGGSKRTKTFSAFGLLLDHVTVAPIGLALCREWPHPP